MTAARQIDGYIRILKSFTPPRSLREALWPKIW